MDIPLVMTILAPDRPGLVESLAEAVAEHGGNWLESRMAHLGGQFAGILRASVPSVRRDEFLAALRSLEAAGMRITVLPDQPAAPTPSGQLAHFTLVGQDRPGIVRQISQAFARHGINVEDLSTGCESAPMSGETLFRAEARVRIPAGCPIPAIRSELEMIAADLMVDMKLQELKNPA